jgi:DNA repair protein RadD
MNNNIVLRPYQKEAVQACIDWVKKNSVGGVCATSGGSGKSIMIAEVARILHEMTGKYVLVIVPNVDLLRQNCEKLDLIGCKYSMYSASASSKSLRHPIVVTTEGTWKSVAKEKAHFKI